MENQKNSREPVDVRMGSKPGVSMRIKHDGTFVKRDKTGSIITGTLEDWTELAVITNLKATDDGYDSLRFYRLVPGGEVNQVRLDDFWVRGSFELIEIIHEPAEAHEAFRRITV